MDLDIRRVKQFRSPIIPWLRALLFPGDSFSYLYQLLLPPLYVHVAVIFNSNNI
jgi:hypothetical protein